MDIIIYLFIGLIIGMVLQKKFRGLAVKFNIFHLKHLAGNATEKEVEFYLKHRNHRFESLTAILNSYVSKYAEYVENRKRAREKAEKHNAYPSSSSISLKSDYVPLNTFDLGKDATCFSGVNEEGLDLCCDVFSNKTLTKNEIEAENKARKEKQEKEEEEVRKKLKKSIEDSKIEEYGKSSFE